MRTRIGLSCPSLSLIPLERSLPRVAEHFDHWEIIAEAEHSPEKLVDQKGLLASFDLSLSIHAPLSDVNIGSVNSEMREASIQQVTRAIRAAPLISVPVVTVHPAHLSPLGSLVPHRVEEICASSVRRLGKVADDVGVTLALENMPRLSNALPAYQHPEGVIAAIKDTGVKLCFDVGHANSAGSIDEFLRYKHMFANVHLHDNMGEGDPHLPLGSGNIDFSRVFNELRGCRCSLIIESRTVDEGRLGQQRLLRWL